MVLRTTEVLSSLYEADETAWLEAMAELIAEQRYEELDYSNLKEYLTDMAIRDRREVKSRLTTLIVHLLKWIHQPDRRTPSWRGTILEQRDELIDLLGRGVLRTHAEAVLAETYHRGVKRASAETQLPPETFPVDCPWTVDEVLSIDVFAE